MLELEGLTKRFGETTAVADLTLVVEPGEFLTLLGPSGCGKTTTLRMIAGFETPTSGRIRIAGRDVTSLAPQRRNVGMVFQNYALFPHLNVYENVAFGLKARRMDRAETGRRVAQALELVDLAGFEKRRVQQLSGGQQQRVALARALAPEPPLLLLDEPLSNLDAALRERTRVELRALLKRLGITAIFVTHDQDEAFALSDRIALMHYGRIEQLGSPETLYASPATPFVAAFLGKANFLPAVVERVENGRVACRIPGGPVWWTSYAPFDRGRARSSAAAAPASGDTTDAGFARGGDGGTAPTPGDRVRVMIRPESLRFVREGDGDALDDALPVRVNERRFAGATTVYRVSHGAQELLVWGGPSEGQTGAEVYVRPAPGAALRAFPAEAG